MISQGGKEHGPYNSQSDARISCKWGYPKKVYNKKIIQEYEKKESGWNKWENKKSLITVTKGRRILYEEIEVKTNPWQVHFAMCSLLGTTGGTCSHPKNPIIALHHNTKAIRKKLSLAGSDSVSICIATQFLNNSVIMRYLHVLQLKYNIKCNCNHQDTLRYVDFISHTKAIRFIVSEI